MRVKSILAFLLAVTFAAAAPDVAQTAAPKQDAASGSAFKDNGDGTITDKSTGLTWQKDDDGKQRSWDSSLTYCKNLSLGGHSDWRLPSLQNLTSLWKSVGSKEDMRKKYFPSMKSSGELYPDTVAPYWSSTEGGSSAPDSAIFVTFNDGGVHIGTKDFFSFYSRCVRLGK